MGERPRKPDTGTHDFEWGPGDGLSTKAIEMRPALEEARRRALEALKITETQDDATN